ncbi:MAG TPA: DinB family protein [Candidatus Acidoferrales bacterium]|nr:DinB family protein [Candidatus Acidoferrales bacterium]
MKEKELVSRANNFFSGDASYGDPAIKILEGITSDSAIRRPDKNSHNAAELLAHIVGWEDVYLKRFQGDPKATIDQNLSFDWKRIDKNEKSAWKSLVSAFEKNHRQLVSCLEQEKSDMAAKEKLLNNIMEHDIYHLGQIALIKKLAG